MAKFTWAFRTGFRTISSPWRQCYEQAVKLSVPLKLPAGWAGTVLPPLPPHGDGRDGTRCSPGTLLTRPLSRQIFAVGRGRENSTLNKACVRRKVYRRPSRLPTRRRLDFGQALAVTVKDLCL